MARNYQASGASRCEKVKIGTDVYTLPILALMGATTLQEQYNVHDATRSQILVAPTWVHTPSSPSCFLSMIQQSKL